MKLAVYNFKGGVGKTAISMNLALELEIGVVTNEPYSPIEDALPQGQFIKVELGQDFPEIPEGMDCLYDLGGQVDQRVGPVLTECDRIIIPTYIDEAPDVKVTMIAIREIEKFNKKIIIVANQSNAIVAAELQEHVNYPVLPLATSKGFKRIYKQQKSIKQQTEDMPLLKHSFRTVLKQFDDIIQAVTK